MNIVEKQVFCVGEQEFNTREEAINHIRRLTMVNRISEKLAASDIYFRDTSADEVATWIADNFAEIVAAARSPSEG